MTTQSKKYVYCFDFVAYGKDRNVIGVVSNGSATYTLPHPINSKAMDWVRKDLLQDVIKSGAHQANSINFLNIILLAD